jgi:GNAT superfamily N-acetyltransferase
MTTAERASITLRPFTDADYAAYVDIANESYPDYGWTVEEVRHVDADWKPAGFFERRVIAQESGVLIGFSDVHNARGAFVPENYSLEVMVLKAARRRGVGTALFDDAVKALRARKARWIRNGVKESDAHSVAFAQQVGAVELRRDWESRLDVAVFDPAPFAGALERAGKAGIRITTLADELAVDPDAVRKAYVLHEAARLDVPSFDPPTASPYERFEEEVLRAPYALPEAHFLAIRAGRYVGESAMGKEGTDPGVSYQHLTGVLRDERGKGIAMALKLKTIEYAKAQGLREIRTWNASVNKPMLAINVALGFARQPAWVMFGKDLSAK